MLAVDDELELAALDTPPPPWEPPLEPDEPPPLCDPPEALLPPWKPADAPPPELPWKLLPPLKVSLRACRLPVRLVMGAMTVVLRPARTSSRATINVCCLTSK